MQRHHAPNPGCNGGGAVSMRAASRALAASAAMRRGLIQTEAGSEWWNKGRGEKGGEGGQQDSRAAQLTQ